MAPGLDVHFARRLEDGASLSMLWWRAPEPLRAVSTALVGGGIGTIGWYLNAQVHADYARTDPDDHLAALARGCGLTGPGVGMLTAVDVTTVERAEEDGVHVLATVGLGWPTWAAAADGQATVGVPPPGTINLFVAVPAPLGDAALVNLVATATEAKVQALQEADVQGTGTASDAVCVACPAPTGGSADHADHTGRFGGPRSHWGARVARAVHRAVSRGAAADWDRAVAGGWPRPPRQHG
ncbi:MAG: adenosylcobinamide amidohydrolase [Acidimicrobiia bacterium]